MFDSIDECIGYNINEWKCVIFMRCATIVHCECELCPTFLRIKIMHIVYYFNVLKTIYVIDDLICTVSYYIAMHDICFI